MQDILIRKHREENIDSEKYFLEERETNEVEKIIGDQVVYLRLLDLERLLIWELLGESCRFHHGCAHTHIGLVA